MARGIFALASRACSLGSCRSVSRSPPRTHTHTRPQALDGVRAPVTDPIQVQLSVFVSRISSSLLSHFPSRPSDPSSARVFFLCCCCCCFFATIALYVRLSAQHKGRKREERRERERGRKADEADGGREKKGAELVHLGALFSVRRQKGE